MFLSDQQIADRYGVSRVTIWRWRRVDPLFPQPISLSPGCVRWREADLVKWEAAKAGVTAE